MGMRGVRGAPQIREWPKTPSSSALSRRSRPVAPPRSVPPPRSSAGGPSQTASSAQRSGSVAGLQRPAAGRVRVGPVYTPPWRRGRGFGGAVTAAVSQAALEAAVEEVLLFTDLANPTSNALYRRLG